ncbi:MAG: methionine--tRNA ligase [Phycisphaerae bacterium]
MPKKYLVTAALPYSNNRLHVGHIAGAYLPADTYVRYLRARGEEVLFICGSDDNGVAIEISALQENTTPQEISSFYHERQKLAFAGLGIDFDVYGGTHQPGYAELHAQLSQQFFTRIYDKGYFTKRRTRQLYDARAGRFLPDRYVRGICPLCKDHETYGDQCDRTGAVIDALNLIEPRSVLNPQDKPEVRETAHWYLRLSEFEKPLQAWLESKQGRWRSQVLNFALGQIKQGLPERAMTRDIQWGIPVPLDDPDARGKVLYVWFDAPIGYMSFTAALLAKREGDPLAYKGWWADPDTEIHHFIGEDNTVFHALIWPAMLMAEGRYQLPTSVVANQFVNFRIGGEMVKISKSQTPQDSPVWIEEFLKRFDPDALRYYLTAIASETARTAFDPADFVARNNNELVAAYGNFVNRALTFAAKYFEGRTPDASRQSDADRAHLARAEAALTQAGAELSAFRFKAGLEAVMAFARDCNLYFGQREPWRTRKDDPSDCAAAIATCIQSVHALAIMSYPFMPGAARRMLAMLGIDDQTVRWRPPEPLPTGRPLGEPKILFPKLEPDCMTGPVAVEPKP